LIVFFCSALGEVPTAWGQVKISEFRTRGPNGANDEFIELYNNSDSAIDISSWRIRASNSGGATSNRTQIPSFTILPARSHYLIVNNNAAGGYSGSVAGDQAYGTGVTDDGGIALTLADSTVVDQIGMSAGSSFGEGGRLGPLTLNSDSSWERKPGGTSWDLQDTEDNSSDFQRIGLSNPQNLLSGPVPIQLASQSASAVHDNDVEVAWRTISETNNYGFEIERRRANNGSSGANPEMDNPHWTKVAFVQGHGTTLAPQSYSYIDRAVPFGKYSYRIRQIDLDGTSETFPEMEVSVGVGQDKFILAQNYPNPFNPSTTIDFVVPQTGWATIKIYNLLGQEVATLFDGIVQANKISSTEFDATGLPSGVYLYQLRSAGKIETKRMTLMK